MTSFTVVPLSMNAERFIRHVTYLRTRWVLAQQGFGYFLDVALEAIIW
jgi:hypothetical protein